MLKSITRISKFFAALLIIFKVPTKLFWWFDKIIFRSVSNKILDFPQQNRSFRMKRLSLFVITRWIYDLRVSEFKRLTNSRILILPRYEINVCISRISLKSALFSNYDNIHCLVANQCNYLKYSRGTFRINFITKCVPFSLSTHLSRFYL